MLLTTCMNGKMKSRRLSITKRNICDILEGG